MRAMRRWACLFREHEVHIHPKWLPRERAAVRCERCWTSVWVYFDAAEAMPTGDAFTERYFTPGLLSRRD